MDYRFLDAWDDFLPTEGGHVIAAFGGGGKTSLLAACAAALRLRGARVAATTTTRSEPLAWPDLAVLDWSGGETVGAPVPDLVFVRLGVLPGGKWGGLAPLEVDRLGDALPDHVVLVEADGSAGRPVKLHRDDEPVWPPRTSLALAVLGLGAVGRPVREVLHRHGRLSAIWLPDDPDAVWTWDLMYRLLTAPGGYLARLPAGAPAVVVLTQLGDCADGIGLFGFIGRVMGEAGVPLVVLAELGGSRPHLRTVCRADREAGERADGPA